MITVKNDDEIKYMEYSGKVTYEVLMELKNVIKPGISTLDIDKFVYEYIKSKDCEPAFLGYDGFPASACVSINDVVVHGIPSSGDILKDGDIVSVDVGSIYKGYYSDSAYTYIVGNVSDNVKKFVYNTREALYNGLSVIKEGVSLNEVCKSIESVAKANGYGVIRELTGHGVGKDLHEDPYIPNYSNDECKDIILKAGNTLAIEPMFSMGNKDVWLLENGWSIATQDNSLCAHFEHTVLVTKDGYKILTGE